MSTKKIQTTLESELEIQLNRIINIVGVDRGEVISQPQYIRELIINHIKEYHGERKSFVDENVKRLMRNLEITKAKND